MELPPPGAFDWSLRGLEEAETVFTQSRDGRIIMEVRHPVVAGVTCEMVHWWFGVYAHLKLQIDGDVFDAFKVWHPRDHKYLRRADAEWSGPLRPGDRVSLSEAYGPSQEYSNTETVQIVRLDQQGFGLRAIRLGLTVADLSYAFDDTPEGLEVSTRLCVGVANGWAKTLINQVFLPLLFDEKKTEAWMLHNVEEVSSWASFLPEVFARREQGDFIVWDRDTEG
ncbi:hypothetical protein [Shimia sp. MIT910701]|uniref:hypothetical protein n=1 Tax=Shimia sp. MIT910701 TaxID=3096987 RepID=UPI00399BBB17